MRIIAGEFRGRRLLDPVDRSTRPITDRVKQSLFDVLAPRLPEARVWDVFAGTGSFGLESLSRGARRATFFERHRPAVVRLRQNIDTLGVADRSRVVTQDVFQWARSEADPPADADLIFCDPPYPFLEHRSAEIATLLVQLARRLADEGLLIFRAPTSSPFQPPLSVQDERTWGSMRVRFLAPDTPAAR